MAGIYKILGIIVAIVGILAGYLTASSIDASQVAGGNDLFSAMLQSQTVADALQRTRMTVGCSIAGVGICFGVVIFGIGSILQRMNRLAPHRGATKPDQPA